MPAKKCEVPEDFVTACSIIHPVSKQERMILGFGIRFDFWVGAYLSFPSDTTKQYAT